VYCPSCGQQNQPNARFCGKCGEKILGPDNTSQVVNNPVDNIPNQNVTPHTRTEVSGGMKIGVILGSLFFPIVGIIMGIIFLNDSNPAKKEVGKTWLWVGVVFGVLWFIFSMMSMAYAQILIG